MDDVRWFAPNRFCALPVPLLREGGLGIATEGDARARLAVAADGTCVVEAYRFARRADCPLLVYLWDLPPWQLAGGKPNRVMSIGGRLVKLPLLRGRYPERNGYYSRLRYAARHAAAVWVPSTSTRLDVERRFGVRAELVPFCFDSDRFNRQAGWAAPREQVILAISRLVVYKNHAAVIRAASLLMPAPAVHIVGRGPEGDRLRELARTLRVELRLDDTWQSDEQIVTAYLGASVVACPSRFEGMGLTPLEGSAMGIPTVASDIPPHREFAPRNVTLVPLDDDLAWATAIAAGLRRRATAAADDDALHALTIEACAKRFREGIEALLR